MLPTANKCGCGPPLDPINVWCGFQGHKVQILPPQPNATSRPTGGLLRFGSRGQMLNMCPARSWLPHNGDNRALLRCERGACGQPILMPIPMPLRSLSAHGRTGRPNQSRRPETLPLQFPLEPATIPTGTFDRSNARGREFVRVGGAGDGDLLRFGDVCERDVTLRCRCMPQINHSLWHAQPEVLRAGMSRRQSVAAGPTRRVPVL